MPEPGFIQPIAQYGRYDLPYAAISGPVISSRSFDKITALFADLISGRVYAITENYNHYQTVKRVNLVDSNGDPLPNNVVNDLVGGRADPRLFTFPSGHAGVLLEATGDFYRLTEVNGN